MTRPIDWREREKALDPGRSWIVQAPAGSGKTELLTQRMLGLLARVKLPEEVVAITFTRKAAAEMNHRLVNCLRAAAAEPGRRLEPHEQASRELALAVLKNSRKRGWNLLEQPSRLRVRTIDSLCGELARQLPILSGMGGGQQIARNPEALYRVAAARTMSAIEDDSDQLQADVIRVLDRYDNQYDRLVELLTSMLGHREQWIGHLLAIKTEDGFDRRGLEDSLRLLIEAELKSSRDSLSPALVRELPRYLDHAISNRPEDESGMKALLAACGGADCGRLDLPVTAEALSHWNTMIRFLLTAGGTWRAGPNAAMGFPPPSKAKGEEKIVRQQWKDGCKELLDSLKGDDHLLDRLNTIRRLPRPAYDDDAWNSLESLMRILIRAFQEWKVVMSESGETDFSEIATRAIQALGTEEQPSNLALRMDHRIEHLLVDEFQDTSMSQIHLLTRLTAGWTGGDGRTLFLVGDPMQSIYRFRKAEVSLFIQAFERRLFRHIDLQALRLQVNFRSSQPIVNWVNEVFPAVMPEHSDPLQDAVHYSQSAARPDAPAGGSVSLRIRPERDDKAEARQAVEVIRKTDSGQSLAVLVRSRQHAREILALLDSLKEDDSRFRYQAIDFNPLAQSPLVQDLVSLTLAVTQAADRLAWLSVLRAPFVGLDLADLDALAGGRTDQVIPEVLARSMDDGMKLPLSDSGRQRLARAAPVLLRTAARRGRESTRRLVETGWVRLGVPACVQNASELDDAATWFDLLESLEKDNLPIDRDTISQGMENLYARPDALASDRLQVMTIYAAKGLQFDNVILPGLNRETGVDQGKLLHWFELAGQDRIVMSPMRNVADKVRQKREGDLIQFISDVEKRRQRLENGRLLYVAATRAVSRLHLFAAITPRKDGQIKPARATLLGELWPAVAGQQTPLIRQAADELDTRAAASPGTAALPQEHRRLAACWRAPAPPESVALARAGAVEARDYIEFRWAGEEARLTGNLVHLLLQQIAGQGVESWLAGGGMTGLAHWCRCQLLSEGVSGGKAGSIIDRTSRAITNCLDSDRGRWILGSHDEAECEFPLTAVLDGVPHKLVLDRTFVDSGVRWIIDYKTSSHSGGNLEGFLRSEEDRYREQLQRYREAVAIRESRPIKTALYFPLLDRFCEL